tara:strand:- start:147 stop:281 length:135 start_codon:yes stop_codon:yes gene_type:complete
MFSHVALLYLFTYLGKVDLLNNLVGYPYEELDHGRGYDNPQCAA